MGRSQTPLPKTPTLTSGMRWIAVVTVFSIAKFSLVVGFVRIAVPPCGVPALVPSASSMRNRRRLNPSVVLCSESPRSPRDTSSARRSREDNYEEEIRGKRRAALLVLSTVPLVWGTYAPSVKYLYDSSIGDGSPPGLIFNLGCYLVSALTLTAASSIKDRAKKGPVERLQGAIASTDGVKGGSPLTAAAMKKGDALRAGLELGGWLFLASTVQVWGLGLTSASSAAFLVQLTTLLVPLLEAALGRRRLSPQIWLACALATVGVTLVSLGGILPPGTDLSQVTTVLFTAGGEEGVLPPALTALLDASAPGNLMGAFLVATSAVFYSLHVVRLAVHVSRVETLVLAKAKAWAELGYSLLAVVVAAVVGGQGDRFTRFAMALAASPELILLLGVAVVWNGAVTTAYAMWAQARGQALVSPSEANLVYSLQPLWSTLFAVLLLKETFGTMQAAGACLLLGALVLSCSPAENVPPQPPGEGLCGEGGLVSGSAYVSGSGADNQGAKMVDKEEAEKVVVP
ncbi:unnamed protein product [Discosporangium mesarthrocarpum]